MKKYPAMPYQLVDGWPTRVETHAGADKVDLHYHGIEEWLEVLAGEISFSPAGVDGRKHTIIKGEALNIPQGELHSIEVGPNEVEYQMWTPVSVEDETFRRKFDLQELSLIKENLDLPEAENRKDETLPIPHSLISKDLTFHNAVGAILGKEEFLHRKPAPVIRSSSGSIRVLHKAASSLILATTVHTEPKAGGPRNSYANLRLMVKDETGWQCLLWVNYPEPEVSMD